MLKLKHSPRVRGLARRALKVIRLGSEASYAQRFTREIARFDDNETVHDLPPIFHYWSNRYLRPKLEQHGIQHPEHFFFAYTKKQLDTLDGPARILSIGAGNCDMEARLAADLRAAGHETFTIECTDINATMLERGRQHAAELGVESHLAMTIGDFNSWSPACTYDVIIANQCLHHVVDLEHLFESIENAMTPESIFLTSDMIGRNGHQRWPEALKIVQEFWQELPESYRWNRLLNRHEKRYVNYDCSFGGFEGIRAQDILPLLVARFNFELFLPFANAINVFIDRPFGGNFDADAEWDRDFIDRVHHADETAMLDGTIKPTQMLAAMRTSNFRGDVKLWNATMTPEFCIRATDQ